VIDQIVSGILDGESIQDFNMEVVVELVEKIDERF